MTKPEHLEYVDHVALSLDGSVGGPPASLMRWVPPDRVPAAAHAVWCGRRPWRIAREVPDWLCADCAVKLEVETESPAVTG